MVAAIAAVVPAALGSSITLFGIPLTTAVGGLTLAGNLVNLGGTLLLSSAANAILAPDVPNITPENVQTNSKTATGPRLKHVGVTKTGANVVFHRANDGSSYRLMVHGHGEINRVLQYYLNNEPVDLDGSGFVTDLQYQGYGRSRVQILSRLGRVPEAHYQKLTDIWPEWSPNHRLDGQWTSLIVCESVAAQHFRGMYPADEPALFALAETSKLYDPRTGAIAFSENLALAIADLITSDDGFNRPNAVDWGNISEEADLCDEQVPLASGGTEARYRVTGSYGLNEKPQEVLNRMLRAGGGQVRLKPNGKVSIELARERDAEFTLQYKHLLEVANLDAGPDGLDRYNVLPGRFVSHDLSHVEVDAEAWRDEARIAADGEELVAGEAYQALMSPSHRQTRGAMKVKMGRDNPKQRLRLVCKPAALPAAYESVIAVEVPELRISGKFEVKEHNLSFEQGMLRAVALTLHKIEDEAFSLALDEQGAVQELPPPDTPSGIPLPENFAAAGAGIQSSQNVFSAGIATAWQAPPSDALSPVLKYAPAGTGAWVDVAVGEGANDHHVVGLIDGNGYDLWFAWVTPGGLVGPEVVQENVIAVAASTPPSAATGLNIADNGDGSATVSMTSSVSASLWQTEVYRDGTLVATFYAGMVGPDTFFEFIDNSGSGTFNWTVRSINVSNVPNLSDAGPVSATIA
ncbi:hypothetical protein [Shimia sp.]|uniref:hypothetical protein n=1 Tax=Shimia sp. TaxID=1954381 RepID=UPI003BAB349E